MNLTVNDIAQLVIRLIAILSITFIMLLVGFIPIKKKSMVKKPIFINIVNSFASGMYFSLSLNIFLPDGQDLITQHLKNSISTDQTDRNFLVNFPWASTLATLGFLMYFTLEKLILNRYTTKELNQMLTNLEYQENVINKKFHNQKQQQQADSSGEQNSESFLGGSYQRAQNNQSFIGNTYFGNTKKSKKFIQNQGSFNVQSESNKKKFLLDKTDSFVSMDTDMGYNQNSSEYDGLQSNTFSRSQLIFGKESQNLGNSVNLRQNFQPSFSANANNNDYKQFAMFILQTIISVYEGIVIGIQTKIPLLLFLIVVIYLKKSSEVLQFSQFLKNNRSKNHRIFIVIYSAITPIGIVIGWIIESFQKDISGYIISFIGGNFIYISASYLLIEEFAFNTHYKWRKYILFTTSLILVIVLQLCIRGLDENYQ